MLRSVWVWFASTVATMGLSTIVVVGSWFHADPALYLWVERTWGRVLLRLAGATVEIKGVENVRVDQPQIIASNHQSWYDVWALVANIPKKTRFVAKEELGRIPIFGRAWNTAGHISVNRSDRVQAIRTLEQFGDLIRQDNSAIVIFPEGTRSPTGDLIPFKKGAFMLALHTRVDIVPTAVIGSRAILRKNDWRIRKGRIIVRFGEPISTAGYDETNREELIALVRNRIAAMLKEGK